jgi:hypothetical protein
MKYTNIYNLPLAIYNACTAFTRKPTDGRLSVTSLIDSPQILKLKKLHWEELEQDVSERLWALLGTLTHGVLESNAPTNSLNEESLSMEIDGVMITGRPDLYYQEQVHDYKVTSVWSFMHGVKKEWERQLNIYAAMYRHLGFKVNSLSIHAILRDFSKGKSLSDKNYPVIPFQEVSVNLWTEEEALDYIRKRLVYHQVVNHCTDEERWKREDKFAIMKEGRKSAVRVFGIEEDCQTFLKENPQKGKIEIVKRIGAYVRCPDFCMVNKFCPQYQADKGVIEDENISEDAD